VLHQIGERGSRGRVSGDLVGTYHGAVLGRRNSACNGTSSSMKWFAIAWIVVGALMVAAAVVILLTGAAAAASATLIGTFACIGVPFLGFGIWGLYAELKPWHYKRRPPKH
jgi:hypothetical protein